MDALMQDHVSHLGGEYICMRARFQSSLILRDDVRHCRYSAVIISFYHIICLPAINSAYLRDLQAALLWIIASI